MGGLAHNPGGISVFQCFSISVFELARAETSSQLAHNPGSISTVDVYDALMAVAIVKSQPDVDSIQSVLDGGPHFNAVFLNNLSHENQLGDNGCPWTS